MSKKDFNLRNISMDSYEDLDDIDEFQQHSKQTKNSLKKQQSDEFNVSGGKKPKWRSDRKEMKKVKQQRH